MTTELQKKIVNIIEGTIETYKLQGDDEAYPLHILVHMVQMILEEMAREVGNCED